MKHKCDIQCNDGEVSGTVEVFFDTTYDYPEVWRIELIDPSGDSFSFEADLIRVIPVIRSDRDNK